MYYIIKNMNNEDKIINDYSKVKTTINTDEEGQINNLFSGIQFSTPYGGKDSTTEEIENIVQNNFENC